MIPFLELGVPACIIMSSIPPGFPSQKFQQNLCKKLQFQLNPISIFCYQYYLIRTHSAICNWPKWLQKPWKEEHCPKKEATHLAPFEKFPSPILKLCVKVSKSRIAYGIVRMLECRIKNDYVQFNRLFSILFLLFFFCSLSLSAKTTNVCVGYGRALDKLSACGPCPESTNREPLAHKRSSFYSYFNLIRNYIIYIFSSSNSCVMLLFFLHFVSFFLADRKCIIANRFINESKRINSSFSVYLLLEVFFDVIRSLNILFLEDMLNYYYWK